MERTTGRKIVSNFFVKRELQMSLIIRVVTAVAFATLISSGVILLMYLLQHKSILLYQLHETGNLRKENILFVILPSLLISLVVNVFLSVFLGLYASRKYAVPIYKMEQWARFVKQGKLNTTLRFREQKQMAETTSEFNSLTADLRQKLGDVKKLVDGIKNGQNDPELARRISDSLANLDCGRDYSLTDETQTGDSES